MKRVLVFFIAIMIMALVLTACKIPFFGDSSDEPSNTVKDGDLVRLDDDQEATGAGTSGVDYPDNPSVAGYGNDAGNMGNASNVGGVGDAGNSIAGAANSGAADNGGNLAYPGDTGVAGSTNSDIADPNSAAIGSSTGIAGQSGNAGTVSTVGNGGNAGGINPDAGGVLDNKEFIEDYSSENTLSDSHAYQPEQGSSSKSTTPATGVLAASNETTSSSFAEPRRPVTVYYQDKDGCVVPMTRWIQPQLGVAKAAVSFAIDSPLTREETVYYGVYPILPEHTEVLGIDIKEGIAIVDFNKYLLSYGTAYSERNIIASIVYTLTEFETIQKVRILINGYPQGLLKYGTDLTEPLGREDIMINTDPGQLTTGKEKLDVYFMKQANTGFTYPVPFSVTDSEGGVSVMPETLVKQLLNTNPQAGMYSEMPQGANLISSYVQDGVIILDFNKEFLNYGGVAREESILKQLAYTLRQCDSIRKITILVEGRKVELPEGTNISAGLAIPVTINDVMDR